jgi:hypothetical protein
MHDHFTIIDFTLHPQLQSERRSVTDERRGRDMVIMQFLTVPN